MEHNHVMVDIETLGLKNDAPIIAIGAVYFNIKTAKILSTFSQNITWDSACKHGVADTDTVLWWEKQDEFVKNALQFEQKPIELVMEDFRRWFPPEAYVWGNGSIFDIGIMEHYYNGIQPWKYYNILDMRTIKYIGETLFKCTPDSIPFTGHKHIALDDAWHQANYVIEIYKQIKEAAITGGD